MLRPMDEAILARLFTALNEHRVRYALFGGLAVGAHGLPRATKDVDLFLDEGEDNVRALTAALKSVFNDAAIDDITAPDLQEYGLIRYGIDDYDFVIDLTQRIGEMFRYNNLEIETRAIVGVQVPVVSARTLIRMKRDTRRPQDQLDVARLRERYRIEDE